MSINLICNECHKTNPIKANSCSKCLEKLFHSNYKVRVKDSVSGKTRTKTVPTLTLARQYEAKFKIENLINSEVSATVPLKTDPKVSDMWTAYIQWAKLNKKSWKDDKSRWTKHVAPFMPSKVSQITPRDHMLPVLSKMANKGYAQATIKQVFILTKRVISWSIKNGIIHNNINPIGDMESPKVDDNRVDNVLNKADLNKLHNTLGTWDNERAVLVIKFALYTGRRKGEILSLKWSDLDADFYHLNLKATNTKSKKMLNFPLNQKAMITLHRAKALQINSSPHVFPNTQGNQYKKDSFDETWKRIKIRAGLSQDFRFHDLRHTFASYLASSGKVDIYVLKELLGHSSIEMTQRYAHLINGATRKAVEVLDEVFS